MTTPATASRRERFESLRTEHQPRLYAMAYSLTRNHDDAQDLLQQSLIEAYTAFDHFQPGTRFDRWVYRIMYHSFLDLVRRRPRFQLLSLDAPWDDDESNRAAHDVPDSRGGPESLLMDDILSEPLQRALDALPPEFRAVVVLADLQELSYEEVARALGCPVGTVRSRLHRARALLRRSLGGRPENVFALPALAA
jgi:RNA polymerase sigma-70 factor, ECF subfamily